MARTESPEHLPIGAAPVTFTVLVFAMGAGLMVSIAVSSKAISVLGLTPSAGVLGYALTFACTDSIAELFGRRIANGVVLSGFLGVLLGLVLILVALYAPPAPFYEDSGAFQAVLGISPRVALAGLVAYLPSQLHDVWAFHFWKEATRGRHLWLRNNLSTVVSQAIDTALFVTIAFAGVFPLVPIMIGQYVAKLLIAVVDTPVVYGVVAWTRRAAPPPR